MFDIKRVTAPLQVTNGEGEEMPPVMDKSFLTFKFRILLGTPRCAGWVHAGYVYAGWVHAAHPPSVPKSQWLRLAMPAASFLVCLSSRLRRNQKGITGRPKAKAFPGSIGSPCCGSTRVPSCWSSIPSPHLRKQRALRASSSVR